MIQKTNKSANGTSFHDSTFFATVDQLIELVGQPDYDGNDGQDKVNFEWTLELADGTVFTMYDWKEYRSLSNNEEIEWHIGGSSKIETIKAYEALQMAALMS